MDLPLADKLELWVVAVFGPAPVPEREAKSPPDELQELSEFICT